MTDNCNDKIKTNSLQKSELLITLNKCFDAVYQVYFQPQEEALSFRFRFLYSLAGSTVFLLVSPISALINSLGDVGRLDPRTHDLFLLFIDTFVVSNFAKLIWVSITLAFASIFAMVIASGYSKHGAIRYFVSGVILPAFTLYSVQVVINI